MKKIQARHPVSKINFPVCVKLNKTGEILVRADHADQLIQLEENWYFHPSLIDQDKLHISDRLYTCPYKGTCNWVDFEQTGIYIPDVSWVYPEPFPEYSNITNWYGFSTSTVHYRTGDCT